MKSKENNFISRPNENAAMKSLQWNERPEEIKSKILEVWNKLIAHHSNKDWVFSGASTYNLCGINEYALVKKLIETHPERKEFFILDIGAGNFSLSNSLAWEINTSAEIPKDIKINIISIRGEYYDGEEITEYGMCKIYNFGGFQIENLIAEFKNRKLELDKKVDLIFSRWTFIHLVDAVGTMFQACSLLRPIIGMLLADGFYYLRNDKSISDFIPEDMWHLLVELKVPFLIRPYNLEGSLDQFVIRRKDDSEFELPYHYKSIQPIGTKSQSYAGHIVSFQTPKEQYELSDFNAENYKLSGEKDLYEYIYDALDPSPRFRPKYLGEIIETDKKEQQEASKQNSFITIKNMHHLFAMAPTPASNPKNENSENSFEI